MNSTSINEDILSKTIQFVRFPLIVGVIMIHSGLEDCINTADYPIFSTIQFLISRVIARVAVPLFFFISGFLFFYKVDTFTLHTYFSKLKKRFRSLLIPYIFWNLIILLGLWCIQTLFPSLFNRGQLIREYGICDWLRCFWNGPVENVPINTALWFIRDLMVMCCLSPIIWILVKKWGGVIVCILGILWLFGYWFTLPGLSIVAIFFFTTGAWFSISNKNFITAFNPNKYLFYTILYALSCAICVLYNNWGYCGYFYVANVNIGIGIIAVITVVGHFIEKGCWIPNTFLAESSFFIYCYHLTLAFARKFIVKIWDFNSESMCFLLYIGWPAFIICLGLGIYYVLKRHFPKFTIFIMGGRS